MVKIYIYKQYFKVTSINFSKLLFTLYDFNKHLTTYKLVSKYKKGRKPVLSKELDKKFYVIEENVEDINKEDFIRYPITILENLLIYLESKDIDKDVIELERIDPIEGEDIDAIVNPSYKPREYQKEYIKRIVNTDKHNILIDLVTGYGKELDVNTPIKIKYGWKRIGDIKVGDKVIGKDGLETIVTGVYPQYDHQLYKVTFEDGRNVDAGLEHLWTVHSDSFTDKVLNTKEIMKYLESEEYKNNTNNGYYIDLPEPSDFEPLEYKIKPYFIGTILTNDVMEQITDKGLIKTLKELSLYETKVWERFIPKKYLEGSLKQRYELLCGIMDIDGKIDLNDEITYTTISKQLAKDVQLLVRSLGGICSMDINYTYKEKYDKIEYKLNIYMKNPEDIFTLNIYKDKLKKIKENNHDLKLKIVSIEKSIKTDAVCIAVDNKDKLYVVKDYIVTHNTFIAMYSIMEMHKKFSVIILPRYINKWIDDITNLTNIKKEEIGVIQGISNLVNFIEAEPYELARYKCFIISLTTLNYLVKYHLTGKLLLYTEKTPDDLFKVLNTTIVLNDETHQEFHNVYKTMLFSNIKLFIGLTATLVSNDSKMEEMYETLFPETNRASNIVEYKPYIFVTSVRFRFQNPKRIRYKNNFGYNQAIFEKSILKNSIIKNNYFRFLDELIQGFYIKKQKDKSDKCLVFMGTVDMCSEYVKHIYTKFKDYRITKYTEEDDYSVINKSNIIISTVLSAGTALDIPGLITTIQTVNIGSIGANLQTLGRLREIKDREVNFVYTWSSDIQQHKKYSYNRIRLFRKRAKHIKSVEYKNLI